MPSITELFIACLAILGASIWAIRRRIHPKPIAGIPHFPITSIWGDIPALTAVGRTQAEMTDYFGQCSLGLGPIFQLLMGPTPMVILADPYEIEDIQLRSRGKSLDASDRTTGRFGGVTPFGQVALPMNDLWKKHRRIGSPFMSSRYLKRMTPRIGDEALALVGYWKDKMNVVRKAGGKCFDCQFDFQLGFMDTITEVAFGENYNGINRAHSSLQSDPIDIDEHGGATFPTNTGTPFHRAVFQHLRRFTTIMKVPPPLWTLYWFIVRRSKSFRSDEETIRHVIQSRIDQAMARATNVRLTGVNEEPDCALDMILERDQQDKAKPYTRKELEDEMITYVLGGFDTTASALSFGVKFLMNHPAVQLKLYDELVTNLVEPKGRAIRYDEIATGENTPYLEAVAHEILRVAQVGAANNRRVLEDIVVLGKVVPKGTDILFLTGFGGLTATKSWAAGKAAETPSFKPTRGFWDDETAGDFMPERWLVDGPGGEKVFSASQGYSLPFGLGPKACFGQKLATLEMKIFLATISLAFFLDKVPDQLNGNGFNNVVTRKPRQSYLSLVDWEDLRR